MLQFIQPETEQTGDQLELRPGLAVSVWPDVGGHRLRKLVGQFSVRSDHAAQCLGEAFLRFEPRLLGRVRFTGDEQTKDAVRAAEALEAQYLLVHPARAGGRR